MESSLLYWSVPFALLLLAIALTPLLLPHFWESNRNKGIIAGVIASPTLVYLILHNQTGLAHSMHEYISFMALLSSLFIISGGIYLKGDLKATPKTNTSFLAIGAVLANFVGTTGASMLLIRPLLNTNQERHRTKHLPIFFIFIVSNVGGLLTPIGDPPLFLGYLKGVPFFWTLQMFPIWLFTNGILLTLFFIIDSWAYRHEVQKDIRDDDTHIEPLSIVGKVNFAFLGLVIAAVFLPSPWREALMIIAALLSLKITDKNIRHLNRFTFHAINEVAVLFLGIFIAMVPALEFIKQIGPSFGIDQPYQFFWITGILSAFLDNAPTYLTFLSLAQGLGLSGNLIIGVPEAILIGISSGAVLMGANSYIGNGPNFMVRAIAEEMKVKTPSFFGYILYAFVILVPVYILVTAIFL